MPTIQELFAESPRRPPAADQQVASGAPSRRSSASAGTTAIVRADRRLRPHGALLDRLRHEAGDGGRDRAGHAPSTRSGTDDVPRALDRLRETRGMVDVHQDQKAAQTSLEWFENTGRYVRPAPAAVHVQPDDALEAHHLRQPGAARPGARERGHASGGPRSRRRCRARDAKTGNGPGPPPMFAPLAVRGLRPRQPHRRVAHVPVLGQDGTWWATGTWCTSAAAPWAAPAS